MATDPQSLLTQAQCFECYAGNGNGLLLMKLALLRQLLLASNPNAVTDPQTLLTQAQCYDCFGGSTYYLMLMELALLNQLVGGGGGGTPTSAAISCGSGPPVIAPVGGCGLYIQIDSTPKGLIWEYYSGSWH